MKFVGIFSLLMTVALLPGFGQTPAAQPQLTPEQMQALIKALQAQHPALPAPVAPLCVPEPPAKPCGWLCREEKRLKAKAEAAAQRQVDKGTDKIGRATHGSVDGTDTPSVHETLEEATPRRGGCPAGYVPAKPDAPPAVPVKDK